MMFTTPPPVRGKARRTVDSIVTEQVRAVLESRPDEWALIKVRATPGESTAVYGWANRRADWECTTRSTVIDGERVHDIYLRYLSGALS